MKKILLLFLITVLNTNYILAQEVKNNTYERYNLEKIVNQINLIDDEEQKVKQWEFINNSSKNYLIINKKDCQATVYNKNGEEIFSCEVGIGKQIGDELNDTRGLKGKPTNTTPAGEYKLIENIFNEKEYGGKTLCLGEKANKTKDSNKAVGLHKIPTFRKERIPKFYDGNISNNRMSHGCINFTEEDYETLKTHIKSGCTLYILTEEIDNKLVLTQTSNSKLEFIQTKYN